MTQAHSRAAFAALTTLLLSNSPLTRAATEPAIVIVSPEVMRSYSVKPKGAQKASETDLQGAERLAELLRARIATDDFDIARTLTASFGVSSYHSGERIEAMIARADRALYSAKAGGRNRVRSERDGAPAEIPGR